MERFSLLVLGLVLAFAAQAVDVQKAEATKPKFDRWQKFSPTQVLQQGKTNFCWAFTAFQMMQLYYGPKNKSADAVKWRAFLNQYDTGEKLVAYLSKYFKPMDGGWPLEAVEQFEKDVQPKEHPWRSYVLTVGKAGLRKHNDSGLVGNDFQAYFDSLAAVRKRVLAQLAKGNPVGYCWLSHCGTLVGEASFAGETTWYAMVDSTHLQDYWFEAERFDKYLADVTMIGD